MKWSREEYIELMTFGKIERQMFVELFGPLIGLDAEWRAQGATTEQIGMTAFDFDYVPSFWVGANTSIMGGETPRVIEDTPTHTISIDAFGRKVKLPKGFATIALPMDYPVKTMDDWVKIKPKFTFCEERIPWDRIEEAARLQKQGKFILGEMQGGFDLPRELMGEAGKDPTAYPDITKYNLEIFSSLGDKTKIYDEIWTEIKTQMS